MPLRAASIFSPAMLPLVSSTMPRLTGTRSALKYVIVLRLVVFVDDEVLLPQTGNESSVRVGHRRRHVDQFDAALEAEAFARVVAAVRRRAAAAAVRAAW